MRDHHFLQVPHLRDLPPAVRWFYIRAWLVALWRNEPGYFVAPASVQQMSVLLELAQGAKHIAELGTGAAWSALAVLLALPEAQVVSYDINPHMRDHYLRLVPHQVRNRLQLRQMAAETGPHSDDPQVDFLFIDSSHTERETIACFSAWRSSLSPNARVVFHDYENPEYPGVASAVALLGLTGQVRSGMFVWRQE